MATFVSCVDYSPRSQHDDVHNWGQVRPAGGSHPFCCNCLAPLGLGGGAGDLSDGAGDPGGSVLLSAIIRYTTYVPGPQSREFILVMGHRRRSLVPLSCNSLMPSPGTALSSRCNNTRSFSFLTDQKMTPKMTEKIYFEYANAIDIELITFG